MTFLGIIGKWFWAAAMVITLLNGFIFRYRSKKHIMENPELEEGYRNIFNKFIIWGNIPWIVMGIGCTVGNIQTCNYFNPEEGNPYVLAFFASVFLVWIAGSYWLFFNGGAEDLVSHPGLFRHELKSPAAVKLYWMVCLIGGLFGVVMMYTTNVPTPLM